MKNKKIKLAVVDDQQLFRQGMISLLKELGEIDVVTEASNGREFIETLKRRKPDVVLLDVEMPEMDGAEVTEYLNKKHPDVRIIILTMHDDEELVFHLARKGAHGFLLKDSDIETVGDAIYTVIEGKPYFKEDISEKLLKGMVRQNDKEMNVAGILDNSLTDREKEILKLICHEHTTREIAEMLTLSIRTVEGHRERICQKIKARNVAGMVKYALQNNLLD